MGAKRRQALLKHFGGLQGIQQAGIKDISKVVGINDELAQKIYQYLKQWDFKSLKIISLAQALNHLNSGSLVSK